MVTVAERFERLVDRSGPHHVWRGAVDRHGVPQFRVEGRLTTARRVAWELRHGELPDAARVRGCADAPRCVRLEHLSLVPLREPPPRVRRHRGDGSMREIKPAVWQLTTTIDSHRAYRTVRADRNDAARELTRLAAQHGRPPATIDALVAAHHAHLAANGRSPSTIRRYEQLWCTWLAPTLADVPPGELHQREVERALAAMSRAGQSDRSIHQAAVVLNTAYAWARDQGLDQRNPVIGCTLPNGNRITASRRR